MFYKITLLIILISIGSATQWKPRPGLQIKTECETDTSKAITYSYCIHSIAGSLNHDVIYYLHGLNGNEHDWINSDFSAKAYQKWGNQAPTVLTISYGPLWILAEKNPRQKSGLFEHFTQIALPNLESKLEFTPAHRILIGASMGGFNASQLYLKKPYLFSKVILACPAITSVGPFSNSSDINTYISRTGADQSSVIRGLEMIKQYYSDDQIWKQSSPILLVSKLVNPSFPPIHVSCGSTDRFGFFDGAKIFVDSIRQQGAQAEWSIVPGPHCSFDEADVIEFSYQAQQPKIVLNKSNNDHFSSKTLETLRSLVSE